MKEAERKTKRIVKKYYTFGKQELTSICGYAPIYGLHLYPYSSSLYNTFEEAEKALKKLLKNSKDKAIFMSTWTIVPIYKTSWRVK